MNELFNEEGQSTPMEVGALVLEDAAVEETTAETPETVVNEVVETTEAKPEAKAEEKPAETEEKPKSLFDQFKKPTEEVVVEKTEVKPEVVDGKKEVEPKKFDNEIIKLLEGGYDLTKVDDIKAFLKKAVGEDYSGLSNENLIIKALNSDPDFLSLSADEQREEIEARVVAWEGMSKYEAQKERTKMLNELNKSADPSALIKALEEVKESQLKSIEDPEKWYQEQVTNDFTQKFEATKTEISSLAKELVGQDYNGFVVTEEVASQIASVFEDQTLNFSTEKATVNAFKIATYDKWGDEREKIGYEKAMKEKMNPSTNSSSAPVIVTKDSATMAGATQSDFFEQANS